MSGVDQSLLLSRETLVAFMFTLRRDLRMPNPLAVGMNQSLIKLGFQTGVAPFGQGWGQCPTCEDETCGVFFSRRRVLRYLSPHVENNLREFQSF